MSDLPSLSRLVNREEMWSTLKDFDGLMKEADTRVRSANASVEAVKVAKLLHDLARSHFHLLLVGQYKIKEIGRGALAAFSAHNETVLFNLARALIEHTAAFAYQVAALGTAVSEISRGSEVTTIKSALLRHRQTVHKLYYNERARVHVNDMIEALTTHCELAKHDYHDLCEFVHPNYGSNKLVSSGELGAGQIRSHAAELAPELDRVVETIERCALLADRDLNLMATRLLVKVGSWIEIACQDDIRLSQIFSVRGATSGDGKTKETAIFFKKARTHHEAIEAFYKYLEYKNIEMFDRRTVAVEDGFLFEVVSTNKGTLWVKYRMST